MALSAIAPLLPAVTGGDAPKSESHGKYIEMDTQRILIVDDNRDSAISLSMMMNLTGYETATAFDGFEAVGVATQFDPHVVLLDIGLPRLNGYEVCRVLRRMPRAKPFVIVALTGWGQDEDRRKSFDAGFDAHLVKPVDPDTLLRTLRELTR